MGKGDNEQVGISRYREDADKKSWQRFAEFLAATLD